MDGDTHGPALRPDRCPGVEAPVRHDRVVDDQRIDRGPGIERHGGGPGRGRWRRSQRPPGSSRTSSLLAEPPENNTKKPPPTAGPNDSTRSEGPTRRTGEVVHCQSPLLVQAAIKLLLAPWETPRSTESPLSVGCSDSTLRRPGRVTREASARPAATYLRVRRGFLTAPGFPHLPPMTGSPELKLTAVREVVAAPPAVPARDCRFANDRQLESWLSLVSAGSRRGH